MNEKICRLCLRTISDRYQEIEETVENILKLNLGITKETVTCIECTNNLQVLFNLKSACIDMRARSFSSAYLKNDVGLDPVKIENITNLEPVTEPNGAIGCSFCTKPSGKGGLVSLLESKENIFLVDILKKHIRELNLSNIGELLTCETCLEEIQIVSNFLMKCLDVEEKISKYTEIQGTNDKGQIELQDVQQFIFKPMSKFEGGPCPVSELKTDDDIQDEFTVKDEGEATYKIEEDHLESFIKIEDGDIKSEQSEYVSFQEPSAEIKWNKEIKNSLDIPAEYQCDTCIYETTCPNHLHNHVFPQKNCSANKMFKCEICVFETKYKQSLKQHKLIHKNSSEITKFKCGMCEYETKRRGCLTIHMLIHKSRSEVKMYKCDICTYETKRVDHLKVHKLIHKNSSEITKFKCEMCEYETMRRNCLKIHMLNHKSRSEVIMYKCDICTYETKRKCRLNEHKLIHKDPSEITMFHCGQCTFETKRKSSLKKHVLLVHKTPPKIMYKCGLCTYEAKYKQDLNRHRLIHHNLSGVMHECDICTYVTKSKSHLNEHKLTHKGPSEITMFKCEMCMFETKRKRDLNRHILTHKNPSEVTRCEVYETIDKNCLKSRMLIPGRLSKVTMYKCETCTFETKRKSRFTEHELTHKSPSDITMFKCEMCSSKVKRKRDLKRHMLTHKHRSGVTV